MRTASSRARAAVLPGTEEVLSEGILRARGYQLTLDTNLIQEYLKSQDRTHLVQCLVDLARDGRVELAVTARIRDDIPRDPLFSRLAELPDLGIAEKGAVFRLGHSPLGRDMIGSEEFTDFYSHACALAQQRKGKKHIPDWRDWDHLHAHLLHGRDVFLTWDSGILCLAPELHKRFGISVMTPEAYLRPCPLTAPGRRS